MPPVKQRDVSNGARRALHALRICGLWMIESQDERRSILTLYITKISARLILGLAQLDSPGSCILSSFPITFMILHGTDL